MCICAKLDPLFKPLDRLVDHMPVIAIHGHFWVWDLARGENRFEFKREICINIDSWNLFVPNFPDQVLGLKPRQISFAIVWMKRSLVLIERPKWWLEHPIREEGMRKYILHIHRSPNFSLIWIGLLTPKVGLWNRVWILDSEAFEAYGGGIWFRSFSDPHLQRENRLLSPMMWCELYLIYIYICTYMYGVNG